MKTLLIGLAALPFVASVAVAGQPLTDQQMDRVTAGFSSQAIADALGRVGASGILLTTTATLSQVEQVATARLGETSSTLYKSISGAQASSISSTFTPAPIPGIGG
jgi:hypothetical protein